MDMWSSQSVKHRPCGGEWLRSRYLALSLWLQHAPSRPEWLLVGIVTIPHGGGRNLTPPASQVHVLLQGLSPSTLQCPAPRVLICISGLWVFRAGMAVLNRGSEFMLGLPCTSVFVGQETLLPVICHLPISTPERVPVNQLCLNSRPCNHEDQQNNPEINFEPSPLKILIPYTSASILDNLPQLSSTVSWGGWCFVPFTEVKYSVALIHPLIF